MRISNTQGLNQLAQIGAVPMMTLDYDIVFDLLMKLKLGDTGGNVPKLQKLLIDNGYDLVPDGKFGVKTETAVKALQERLIKAGATREQVGPPGVWTAGTSQVYNSSLRRLPNATPAELEAFRKSQNAPLVSSYLVPVAPQQQGQQGPPQQNQPPVEEQGYSYGSNTTQEELLFGLPKQYVVIGGGILAITAAFIGYQFLQQMGQDAVRKVAAPGVSGLSKKRRRSTRRKQK